MMNQFYASGKSTFKATLRKNLKIKINEVQFSKKLSKEEKNMKIITLKREFQKKINQSEFYNF